MAFFKPLSGFFSSVTSTTTQAVSGQAVILSKWFKDTAEGDKEVFEQYQRIYDTVVKALYSFYLNPLVTGAPIPELSSENVFSAFEEDPFVPNDLFDPLLQGEDKLQIEQLRNIGRRLIYQARAVADLVHMQGMSPLGTASREELQQAIRGTAARWRRISQSDAAYFAFFAELLVVLRIGLTFTYAVIETMRRLDAVVRGPAPATSSDDPNPQLGPELYIDEFPRVLREAIKAYKLGPFVDFITERASKSIVNPVRDTSQEVYLGQFESLAPTLNAINNTLRRLGLSEAPQPNLPLLIDNAQPFDLSPEAIVGQLVNMLNFHASYSPRSEFVVQNSVLAEYAELERRFDGTIASSDPNTALIRAFMFVELAVVEDWSLFCRATGLFGIQPGEPTGILVDPVTQQPTPRPRTRFDAEYPSILPNDGSVASVYWRTAWRSIRGFVEIASPESVLKVISAFVSVQQFHAGTGFPATTVLLQSALFNADVPVQDEVSEDGNWRTTGNLDVQFVKVPNTPSRELVYGTSDALFKSIFVEPSPYKADNFEVDRTHRTSQFFEPKNIQLLLRSVAATLHQCIYLAFPDDIAARDMSARVIALYERITQPYDPRNRSELDLDENLILLFLDEMRDISLQFEANSDNRVRTYGRPRQGVLVLFEIGCAIVNACLISTIAKGPKLLYPPPIADICIAWIELYVKSFDRVTNVQVQRGETRIFVPSDQVQVGDQRIVVVRRQDGNIETVPTDEVQGDENLGPVTVLSVNFTLDNVQEDLDNAFTRINIALEQLVDLKVLLDPDNQRVLQLVSQAERLEAEYASALQAFTNNPSPQATRDLGRAATVLSQHSQQMEQQFSKKPDLRLRDALFRSRQLLTTYLPLVKVRGQNCIH